jgi:hypothetical protein
MPDRRVGRSPIDEPVATAATRQIFELHPGVVIEALVEGGGAPIVLLTGSGSVRLVELANAGHALVPEEPDANDHFIRELD